MSAASPRPLDASTVSLLPPEVRVPAFDRSRLTASVVHLGVGGFARSHQLPFFDDLADLGVLDWGVVGVSLRSPAMRDSLQPQDFLYTLVERSQDVESARVVGSLLGCLYAPEESEAVLELLSAPSTLLVTLTVTEAGYLLDPVTGLLDSASPEVLADLRSPSSPATMPGYLVEALARRRRAGLPGFTVLSCDNRSRNGAAAREAVVGFAHLRSRSLARWIERNVSFPNSMVDRITPTTTGPDRAWLPRRFGVADRSPVFCEPFSQWVVEDDFVGPRPPLDLAGVSYVDDVRPYQLCKGLLLNGSHRALGYLGRLSGLRHTAEAMANPALGELVAAMMEHEVAPLLPQTDQDLAVYRQEVLSRLSNRRIADRLDRLCAWGSVKLPTYVLPSLVAARRAGLPHPRLTLVVAAWCLYVRGADLFGRPLEVRDARAAELRRLALAGGSDPRPLLGLREVFGTLSDDELFADELHQMVLLLEEGLHVALSSISPPLSLPAPAPVPLLEWGEGTRMSEVGQ